MPDAAFVAKQLAVLAAEPTSVGRPLVALASADTNAFAVHEFAPVVVACIVADLASLVVAFVVALKRLVVVALKQLVVVVASSAVVAFVVGKQLFVEESNCCSIVAVVAVVVTGLDVVAFELVFVVEQQRQPRHPPRHRRHVLPQEGELWAWEEERESYLHPL